MITNLLLLVLDIHFKTNNMKKLILVLCLLVVIFELKSQVSGYSQKKYISMVNQSGIMEKVENYVNSEIEIWQQKGRRLTFFIPPVRTTCLSWATQTTH